MPLDQPARDRFARYRGLESFRTTYWDPKESLPPEFARIFQFKDFRKMETQVCQVNIFKNKTKNKKQKTKTKTKTRKQQQKQPKTKHECQIPKSKQQTKMPFLQILYCGVTIVCMPLTSTSFSKTKPRQKHECQILKSKQTRQTKCHSSKYCTAVSQLYATS